MQKPKFDVMTLRWLFAFGAILISLNGTVRAMTVDEYAKACFKAVEIKPSDIPKKMNCKKGELLDVTVNGQSLAQESCNEYRNPGSCDTPKQCDHKAWLNDKCYGNTYLTTFTAKSNSDVTVALLCRHKHRNTDTYRSFDDVAMIVHNKSNGETCWFQTTDDDSTRKNGKRAPNPTRRIARLFWLPPEETADIECIKCHDSGPFITSPWLNQAKEGASRLRDMKKSPYLNSTPPFDQWPEPIFISVGRKGLHDERDKPCAHCHHIAALDQNKAVGVGGTCSKWIDLSTSVNEQHMLDNKVFMPPKLRKPLKGKFSPDGWQDRMKEHVDAIKDCCRKFEADPNYKRPGEDKGKNVCRLE